ncbi:hypothetical protein K2173_005542 [Erythroxylum novogranatense]|uniref:MYND-type domain-containing protein n=1 Tax=Erythroxylum novogranatense TaxID=1862640 RepID=A0AAV8SKC3_9ROSI|nr:hypothetical protein K2173_005542 [Erythroxylum novogranatense]
MGHRKRQRICEETRVDFDSDLFHGLPDDLVLCVLCKLGSSASCPSDFVNALLTCRRLNRLSMHPLVLSKAAPKTFAIKGRNWSDSAHRFLIQCATAGNYDACYTLGMIRFYCLRNRGSGQSLMARAAIKSHAPALYSLAVIQFNGSGGAKTDKNLRAAVALCARAASLDHVDALRELGHCLQDGYGIPQRVAEGTRLLTRANARELAWLPRSVVTLHPLRLHYSGSTNSAGSPLLSDFEYSVPSREVHPVNQFMREWFESGRGVLDRGLRLCSHGGCGRPETRPHEFRRCSACGTVNYCSRACQALDWKLRHERECSPVELFVGGGFIF